MTLDLFYFMLLLIFINLMVQVRVSIFIEIVDQYVNIYFSSLNKDSGVSTTPVFFFSCDVPHITVFIQIFVQMAFASCVAYIA